VLEDAAVVDAMRAGAIGYLLKDTEARELIRAIKAAALGQVELSSPIAARLMKGLRSPEPDLRALTDREAQVLGWLARGKSNKDISQALGLSEQTVKTHVSHILKKLGLPSRTQAALYALQAGLASDL
jgi:DNA-binding NarL/FixJ family response regulator